MWEVVEDSTLTSGEREIAHRDAGLAKKAAGTMFLVAPLGLGLWLSYQFKAEDLGIAELLTITPLIGFGVGLGVAALRDRGERPGRPPG